MDAEIISAAGQKFNVVFEGVRNVRTDNPALRVIDYNPGARKNKADKRYQALREDIVGKNNRIEDPLKAVHYQTSQGADVFEFYEGIRRYAIAKELDIDTVPMLSYRPVNQAETQALIDALFKAHNETGVVAAHTAAEKLGTALRGGPVSSPQIRSVRDIVWAIGLPVDLLKRGKDGFLSPNAIRTAVKAAGLLVGAFPKNVKDATKLQLDTAREVLIYMVETNSTLGVQNWSRGILPNVDTLREGLKTRKQLRQTDRGVRLCNPKESQE